MELFLIGQLVGLPTLNAILTRYGITSNNYQKKHKSIHEELSNRILRDIFEFIFENNKNNNNDLLFRQQFSVRTPRNAQKRPQYLVKKAGNSNNR